MKLNSVWVAEAELFLRKTMDGGTMILGVVRDEVWPETAKGDEVWLATITVQPSARFDPERQFEGMMANQILCSAVVVKDMKVLWKDHP